MPGQGVKKLVYLLFNFFVMDSRSKNQRLKRIVNLSRQNKELEDHIKKLEREKERLLDINEKYRQLIDSHKLENLKT
jgi:predicted ribosome quality control (RQC) complex YloA/Tae2 family protein